MTKDRCACGGEKWATARRCRGCDDAARRRPMLTCEQCTEPFQRRKRSTRDAQRFCSKACAGKHRTAQRLKREAEERAARFAKNCIECGTNFIAQAPGQRLCSAHCRKARLLARQQCVLGRARTADQPRRICRRCATSFSRKYGQRGPRVFCSTDCQQRWKKQNDYAASLKSGRIGTHVQRAKHYGVAFDTSITSDAVFLAAGWRCQICERETPRELKGTTDQLAPELDHILPLSAGGGHVWENVQCACRKCNQKKGARVPTEAERSLWWSRRASSPLTQAA